MRANRYRIWAVLLLVLALTAAMIGAVYAYLSNTSETVTNTLTPVMQVPTIEVREDWTVKVETTSYPVYVRAAILITWKNGDMIYATLPVQGTDYVLNWDDTNWFQGSDGFYYYRNAVGGDTLQLIQRFELTDSATIPTGYSLHAELIVQTIQAVGYTDLDPQPAVTDAWGIGVAVDGSLIAPGDIGGE